MSLPLFSKSETITVSSFILPLLGKKVVGVCIKRFMSSGLCPESRVSALWLG